MEATSRVDAEEIPMVTAVSDNADETGDGIQEISRAREDQATSMEESVSMIGSVADTSRTTADEAERVSATAEKQVSSMERVSTEAESLAEQADRLQRLLTKFEVGGTRT